MEYGAVAFLDLLGAKGIWSRTDPDKVIADWQEVSESFTEEAPRNLRSIHDGAVDKLYDDLGQEFGADLAKVDPDFKESFARSAELAKKYFDAEAQVFSDTIIITVTYFARPSRLVSMMASALVKPFLMAFRKGLFLRGAISVGELYRSGSLLIGPAIDEAAQWYGQADWIGVMCAPSALAPDESTVERENPDDWPSYLTKYNIPTKHGVMTGGLALNWPGLLVPHARTEQSEEASSVIASVRSQLIAHMNKQPLGPSVFFKYSNTLAFFDHCCGNPTVGQSS